MPLIRDPRQARVRAPRKARITIGTAAAAVAVLIGATATSAHPSPQPPDGHPWLDPSRPSGERTALLLDAMTLDEKISMVHGVGYATIPRGRVAAIPWLGVPELKLHNGPAGVGDVEGVTAFPAPISLAAAWNPRLARRYGGALAEESRGKGVNVLLAPGADVMRVPQSGRIWESAGEDPHLSGRMAAQQVRGVQREGVIANVKHYVNNNQETGRYWINAKVDERTRREIYYPPFRDAVQAGVGSAMCSYNRINGSFGCENADTLGALKKDLGFKGWVLSDWWATRSVEQSVAAGLDQSLPDDRLFGVTLKASILTGRTPRRRLDDMVRRILTPMFKMGLFDRDDYGSPGDDVRTPAHRRLARKVATKGTTLLKNAGDVLPLNNDAEIAVIGKAAHDDVTIGGTGSGNVIPPYVVTPLEGIRKRAERVTYTKGNDIQDAARRAKNADVAVVVAGVPSGEHADRPDLSLPGNAARLITAVASANPRTVVVLTVPGPVLMPWAPAVKGILVPWFAGQELGNALGDVLFGYADPSGRTPVTFARSEADYPARVTIGPDQTYDERLRVGYRHFDARRIEPRFPFGHGLSYTRFAFSDLSVHGTDVGVTVRNTGDRAGTAVPQLYLGFPEGAGEPPRQLRAFRSVRLAPGESRRITFSLSREDFQVWGTAGWTVPAGRFTAHVGSSSRDLPLSASISP